MAASLVEAAICILKLCAEGTTSSNKAKASCDAKGSRKNNTFGPALDWLGSKHFSTFRSAVAWLGSDLFSMQVFYVKLGWLRVGLEASS